MDDVYVYILDLPGNVTEMVVPCLDGYTIYLDARLSPSESLEAYNHALFHIRNHDFEKSDVQQIEASAHNKKSPALCPKDG